MQLAAVLVTALMLSSTEGAPTAPPKVHPLRYHLLADSVATGTLLAGWVTSEALFKKRLAPAQCGWCDRAADGADTLNGLDAWGRGLRGAPALLLSYDSSSNQVTFGALPAAVIGIELYLAWSDGALNAAPVDVLIIAEAVALAISVNQVVKFAIGRERPFVHALPDAEKSQTHLPSDNNLSFFSGHSTFAFSLAVAAGTVASLRGYRNAWVAWAVGLPVAAMVPLLRMAADRHYLSDVLIGSAFGAAVGYGLPTLLHGRLEGVSPTQVRLQLVPSPGGLALGGVF